MSLVSKRIRDYPRGIDVSCVNCGNPNCCWCHLPDFDSGMGQKNDDVFGFIGCSKCHDYADGRSKVDALGYGALTGGRLDYEWRYRQLRRSIRELLNAGIICLC